MKWTAWPLFACLLGLVSAASFARNPQPSPQQGYVAPNPAPLTSDRSPLLPAFRPAVASTTLLHAATFNGPGGCTPQGWVAVDRTAQTGNYFHVDDYAGLPFGPLSGARSLWCGARAATTGPLCGYATLPGYGNYWDQGWCTMECIAVGGSLDVSFTMRLDTEPSYDSVRLEYSTQCASWDDWIELDGGINAWDGARTLTVDQAYDVGGAPSARVRIRFVSDGAWSDEDGLFDSDGAVHVDDLAVEGLALEDFEGGAPGATSTHDWTSCTSPGYGVFAGLVNGNGVLQNQGDGCTQNLGCMWAFFVGSASDYGCAGYPGQKTIPYGNPAGQYFHNEVWSPVIPLTGTGGALVLDYWRYNDFPFDALVFPTWSVRGIGGGCPGPWSSPILYPIFGDGWTRVIQPLEGHVDLGTTPQIQVSLGAVDMCGLWCGTVGNGLCHSHAPLYDNVKVYRVDPIGPQWSIRDIDQFQDNFAEIMPYNRPVSGEFTAAGRARADMASDIAPGNHASIIPGDSSVVKVTDPVHGLGVDPGFGGAAVYCYVSVWPQGQADKTGFPLTQSTTRWPVVGSWTDGAGTVWTCVRLDSSRVNAAPQPDIYCVDLNDNLFESGDTVCFFYSARNAIGEETVAFGSNLALTSDDRNEAASDPAEFTILPAGGVARGGDLLYVDGMDGRGAQPYWDTAFASMGLGPYIDRYDVRGPSAAVANRLAGRMKGIEQLLPSYRVILWDCGDLPVTLGDGSGTPEKTDDYFLLDVFLANVTPTGGVYLCGDDVPSALAAYDGEAAALFRTVFMPFNLTTGDHRPAHGVSPLGTAVAGAWNGAGATDPTFVIHGGCPLLNDFDVMEPQGSSVNEITFGPGTIASANGALVRNVTGVVQVVIGGFSFIYVRDDDDNGVSDRAHLLYDILLQHGTIGAPTPIRRGASVTRLGPNYPNPFNPQTTIAFSLSRRGAVRIAIYDVAGRLVRTLVDEVRGAGAHTVSWDGRGGDGVAVASGVYFCKLVAGEAAETRKMVLLK